MTLERIRRFATVSDGEPRRSSVPALKLSPRMATRREAGPSSRKSRRANRSCCSALTCDAALAIVHRNALPSSSRRPEAGLTSLLLMPSSPWPGRGRRPAGSDPRQSAPGSPPAGPLGAPARVQQARQVRAARPADGQVDRPDPGVPALLAVSVAVGQRGASGSRRPWATPMTSVTSASTIPGR